MSKFIKKLFILLGFLTAIGAVIMFFAKRQEADEDLFDEDDDFDDITLPTKSLKKPSRSYINLV